MSRHNIVETVQSYDSTLNPKFLGEDARRFFDPEDKRLTLAVWLRHAPSDNKIMPFARARLIEGLMRINGVKTLFLDPADVIYDREPFRLAEKVHGMNPGMRLGLKRLPINQALPIGTKFHIDFEENNDMYAKSVMSYHMTPTKELPSNIGIPFNRRTWFMSLFPGERLSLTTTVVESDDPTDRLISHHRMRLNKKEPNEFIAARNAGFEFGTLLGLSPTSVLKKSVKRIEELYGDMRMDKHTRNPNSDFRKIIDNVGYGDIEKDICAYTRTLFDEILHMDPPKTIKQTHYLPSEKYRSIYSK